MPALKNGEGGDASFTLHVSPQCCQPCLHVAVRAPAAALNVGLEIAIPTYVHFATFAVATHSQSWWRYWRIRPGTGRVRLQLFV